jgi:Transposase DDE domain group 1
MTIDLDSTIWEVHGHHKGGAAFGYTRVLGYHRLLATRADTGEVLHARQRTGRAASGRGAERFVNELAGRIRRAGASGPLILRADSGFWAAKVLAACRRHGIQFSITVRQTKTVAAAIAAIPEHAWADIDYPDGGHAQVAETTLGADRLIVRRTRLVGPQATLWPDWRSHAFVTDRQGSAITLDADHRRHAVCELAIRDLKDGAGLRHCPSGVFLANAAWLVLATLAHNLLRWVATIGLGSADLMAKTLRRRLLHLPGRLTRSARPRQPARPTHPHLDVDALVTAPARHPSPNPHGLPAPHTDLRHGHVHADANRPPRWIQAKTNRLAGRPVRTGASPQSLATGGGSLWVANHDAGTVTRIDQASGEVVADIPVPSEPHRGRLRRGGGLGGELARQLGVPHRPGDQPGGRVADPDRVPPRRQPGGGRRERLGHQRLPHGRRAPGCGGRAHRPAQQPSGRDDRGRRAPDRCRGHPGRGLGVGRQPRHGATDRRELSGLPKVLHVTNRGRP